MSNRRIFYALLVIALALLLVLTGINRINEAKVRSPGTRLTIVNGTYIAVPDPQPGSFVATLHVDPLNNVSVITNTNGVWRNFVKVNVTGVWPIAQVEATYFGSKPSNLSCPYDPKSSDGSLQVFKCYMPENPN